MAHIENSLGNITFNEFQDNIDIVKYIPTIENVSLADLVDVLNNIDSFTISEIQSLWIVQYIYEPSELEFTFDLVRINKFKVINKGKGTYGLGGIDLTVDDLLPISSTSINLEDIENNPETQIYVINDLEGLTVSQYINQLDPAFQFQDVSIAPRLIKVTEPGLEADYLFLPIGGLYGLGELQTTDLSFQLLDDNSSPVVTTRTDLPEDFQIYCSYDVDNNNGNNMLYRTNTDRQLYIRDYTTDDVWSTNWVGKIDNTLVIIGQLVSNVGNYFVLSLKDCEIINNILVPKTFEFRELEQLYRRVSNNVPYTLHSSVLHRGFLYAITRTLGDNTTVPTQIFKINPYDLSDLTIKELSTSDIYNGSTSVMQAYKNNLYFMVSTATLSGVRLMKIDENLENPEILFITGNVISTKRVSRDGVFLIYNDEVYIPYFNNSSTLSGRDQVGMFVYDLFKKNLKREIFHTISSGSTVNPVPHWISEFGGKIIFHTAGNTISNKRLIVLNATTLELEGNGLIDTVGNITNNNGIDREGNIYLCSENTGTTGYLYKVKYNDVPSVINADYADSPIGFYALGCLERDVNEETVISKISQLENDLAFTNTNPTTNKVPKKNASGIFVDSLITDNGTNISIQNDAIINGIKIGKGNGNLTNLVLGEFVLNNNTTGTANIAIGNLTLFSNTLGYNNTAIGDGSMNISTSGYENTAIGSMALQGNQTGFRNVALGAEAGKNGISAGIPNASNSIFIGYNSKAFANNQTNEIVIGSLAEGKGSNTVTLGNNSIQQTHLKGNVTINNPNVGARGLIGSHDFTPNLTNLDYPQKIYVDNAITSGVAGAELLVNKGVNNGYSPLDSGGKVPLQHLPSTLLKYIGTWNASTNTPTLVNPDLTKVGNVYNVSVAGTQFGINFSLGDWLIYNSLGIPEKSDNSDDVVSVNGQTGVVTLNADNIDESATRKWVSPTEKTTWNNKQDAIFGTVGVFSKFKSGGGIEDSALLETSSTIESSKIIVSKAGTNGGFENLNVVFNAHNNVWRFRDYPETGIAFYEGTLGNKFGFHFGNKFDPKVSFDASGRIELSDGVNTNHAVSLGQLNNKQFLKSSPVGSKFNTDLPSTYPSGISSVFANQDVLNGFPNNYGSVLTVRAFDVVEGGTMQLAGGYNVANQKLKYRFSDQSTGNWDTWKDLAFDNEVIHTTGNETINGEKTFTDGLIYTKAKNISFLNLNDFTEAGFYNGNDMLNAPDLGWYWVTVERYSGNDSWVHQTATSLGSGNIANRIYTRVKNANVWGSWEELTTKSFTDYKYLDKSYLLTKLSTNANTVIEGTQTQFLSGANQPAGTTDGSLLTLAYNADFVNQMFADWRTNKWFTRSKDGTSWLNWKELAHLEDVVNKTGDETISGVKTFTDKLLAKKGIEIESLGGGDVGLKIVATSPTEYGGFDVYGGGISTLGRFQFGQLPSGEASLYNNSNADIIFSTGGVERFRTGSVGSTYTGLLKSNGLIYNYGNYVTTDLNDIKTAGFYLVDGANRPTSSDIYFLTVESNQGTYTHQTATSYGVGSEPKGIIYSRVFYAGTTWSDWKKLAHVEDIPTTLLDLTDTPSSYAGQGTKKIVVKADETGIEFVPDTGGGSGLTQMQIEGLI